MPPEAQSDLSLRAFPSFRLGICGLQKRAFLKNPLRKAPPSDPMLTSYDGMTHVKFKGFLSALALREGTPGCKFNCAANFLHHNPISNLRRCQGLSYISRQAFPASTLQRHILKTGKPAARAAKCPPHFFAPCPASHSPATPYKAEVSALHLQPFPAKRSFCGRQANALFFQIRQKRSGVPSAEGTPPIFVCFMCAFVQKRNRPCRGAAFPKTQAP